ncbi:MAG: acyltransferase domain-containing protein [Thermoanaerobaculia bacterium]
MATHEASSSPQLLLLSAATAADLEQTTAELSERLRAASDLAAVAAALRGGLESLPHRRTWVGTAVDGAVAALAQADPKRLVTAEASARSLAFMFSGQGAQYPGMGAGLYASQPVFRSTVDRCCDRLEPDLGCDLRTLLFPAEGDETAAAELGQTRNTQPALFVIELATARLWQSWGVEPDAMIGHSIGEYAAACLAGVMTVEEALALVAARGRLMQSLPSGDMLSVPRDEEDLRPLLPAEVSIATINAPGRCVVSGPAAPIAAFREELAGQRIRAAVLHTSHAFHSAMMDPILEPFTAEVRKIDLQPPRIPYVSNVTGTWITAAEATDPAYYATHLRRAVRFADGAGELLQAPNRVLLEVGPGNTLALLAGRHPASGDAHLVTSSIRHPRAKNVDDPALILETLGRLWTAGVEIDWGVAP